MKSLNTNATLTKAVKSFFNSGVDLVSAVWVSMPPSTRYVTLVSVALVLLNRSELVVDILKSKLK